MEVYALLTKRRRKDQPLEIGAVKANIGPSESGVGRITLIKALFMLQKNAIPLHVGIKNEINSTFTRDFNKRNLHIAFEMTPWPQVSSKRRLAAVNSVGAAGANTTVILEGALIRDITETDPRPIYIIAVCNAQSWRNYCSRHYILDQTSGSGAARKMQNW